MVNEEIVGTDIDYNWNFNNEGDLAIVQGSDNLSQAIYLRLTAYLNSLSWAYDLYGSLTKDWLGKNQNPYTHSTLISEIKKRVELDPRINNADVSIMNWTGYTIGIKIRANIADGTTFQEYFIFSDMPRTNDSVNSPQWSNTWIDTKYGGYYTKPGEYITVHCYVRDEQNKIVPIGEVALSMGGFHVDIEENPQRIAPSGSEDPGSCIFTFRVPPFIKLGTHKLKFKYKGIRGYNNCEGETDIYVLDKLPTYIQYKYPSSDENWYYSNDYDKLTDPVVHVRDVNDSNVLHGEVRYYINDYLEDGTLIFIQFPIIFHNSVLLQKTVCMYCSSSVLDYSEKLIFNVDYMFRPGNVFRLTGKNNEHIDYLECQYDYETDCFYLISTIACRPYETGSNGERLNTDFNDDVDVLRKTGSHITMKVIE